MPSPKPPLRRYLPPWHTGDYTLRPGDAPPVDPQLPLRAIEFRKEHGLVRSADFSGTNITVWRIEATGGGGGVEYIVRQNTTTGALSKQFGKPSHKSGNVGIHSEIYVADEISRRRDVLSGTARITQVFTERFPCRECQGLLSKLPYVKSSPFYYYLSYDDQGWQREQANGSWGRFLQSRYNL